MSRLVSFFMLAAVVAVVGLLFFQVMAQFLLPLFLAVVLTVMFRPVHRWLTRRLRGRVRTASLLTTLLAAVLVLAPLLIILFMAVAEGVSLYQRIEAASLQGRLDRLRLAFGLTLPPEGVHESLRELETSVHALDDLYQPDAETITQARQKVEQAIADLRGVLPELEAEAGDQDAAAPEDSGVTGLVEPALKKIEQTIVAWADAEVLRARRAAYSEARLAVAEVKEAIVGSPFAYWLKLQANPTDEHLEQIRERLQERLGPAALSTTRYVGGSAVRLLVGSAIMLLALYYFLADGPGMVSTVMQLSPLKESYERRMIDQFDVVSRAVVLATLLSAGAQGLLAGVGYLFAGFQAVFLLTFLTMILALVPFVGAAAVWASCSIWLLVVEQRVIAAVALAVYGLVVVSMADNVIKPFVLQGRSNLHPLLALLSVIGGVQVLGPIGIFVGPMVVAFLQALLVMLNEELQSFGEPDAVKET